VSATLTRSAPWVFYYFASCILVSHAYIHLVISASCQGRRHGSETGDIIHGDQHGVATIPMSIAAQIPEAVAKVEGSGAAPHRSLPRHGFTVAKLKQVWQQVRGYAKVSWWPSSPHVRSRGRLFGGTRGGGAARATFTEVELAPRQDHRLPSDPTIFSTMRFGASHCRAGDSGARPPRRSPQGP